MKPDWIKEEIGYFKVLFAIFATIFASIVGFVVVNFQTIGTFLLILSTLINAIFIFAIIYCNARIIKLLKFLKKL